MWSWFNCYLSGRHKYGMWCEDGTMFLRCLHCGKRSPGWAVTRQPAAVPVPEVNRVKPELHIVPRRGARVVPFNRTVIS